MLSQMMGTKGGMCVLRKRDLYTHASMPSQRNEWHLKNIVALLCCALTLLAIAIFTPYMPWVILLVSEIYSNCSNMFSSALTCLIEQ